MTLVSDIPAWLAKALERPIAIFGRGASGLAAAELVEALGGASTLFDERGKESDCPRFTAADAARHSLVVSSPGFPESHPWFAAAREAGLEIVPEMDLGACFWKGPIVAVTGTNGKTTLTEFLEKAFLGLGVEAYACGNIGRPLSRLVARGSNREAMAVCEVSSFQAAQSTRLAADYVLWTNFDEDHLDRHRSMEEYFACKYRLVENMRGDCFLYGASVQRYAQRFGYRLEESGLVSKSVDLAELGIRGTSFENFPERSNYLKARALWLRMGLEESELIKAANAFNKSPHRMELVASIDGRSYWDDSKATNFHAVFGGLARFTEPVVWIGGGKDKGGNAETFAARLKDKIVSAHLIGETAPRLSRSLREHGVETHVYESMEAAVNGARAASAPGDNILLSPGYASFDMFDGYAQRGESFKKAIGNLQ